MTSPDSTGQESSEVKPDEEPDVQPAPQPIAMNLGTPSKSVSDEPDQVEWDDSLSECVNDAFEYMSNLVSLDTLLDLSFVKEQDSGTFIKDVVCRVQRILITNFSLKIQEPPPEPGVIHLLSLL